MASRLTWLFLCFSLSASALAQSTAASAGDGRLSVPALPAAVAAAQRPDEVAAARSMTLDVLGRPVTFRLGYEGSLEKRGNFDLDRTRQRDRDVHDHELKLGVHVGLADRLSAYVQAVGLAERRVNRRDFSVQTAQSWERGQAWLLAEGLGGRPLSAQVGRVALIERRSWWWDEDLDAVRAIYAPQGWRLETGLAREMGRVSTARKGIDPKARGVTRWFGQASLNWAPRHRAEAFWLLARDGSASPALGTTFAEDDEDPVSGRQRWLGVRATGERRWESGYRWTYRADLGLLRGRERRTGFGTDDQGRLIAGTTQAVRLRSHAWDLGTQWVLPGDLRPTFSLGLAQGSGGGVSGGIDRSFQQTGLQENKARVGGVKRLRYYGELLDPELSNLRVASAGFGLRWLQNSSAEILWHRYQQVQALTRLAGSRLGQAPTGLSRELGHEIDLFIAMREFDGFELTLTLARFLPGAGFAVDRRDPAHSIELGVAFGF
jgi:alginate production protein